MDPRFLDRLIEETFPDIRVTYAARLALEEQILRAPTSLNAEQRIALIKEPFHYLAPAVEEFCTGDTRFDKQSGLGCLGTLASVVVVFLAGRLIYQDNALPEWLLVAMLALFIVGTLYTVVQLALGQSRVLGRRFVPALARSLKPLSPSRDELTACLEQMKALGFRIGKKVKLDKLWHALQSR